MFSKVKDGTLEFTKKHYLMSLLATYVDMFLYSILSSIIVFPISFIFAFGMMIPIFMLQAENAISILGVILLVIMYFLLFFVCMFLSIFCMGIMITSLSRAFIETKKKGKFEFGDLFTAFSINFKNVLKVHFKKALKVSAWSMLFYIPGTIKYLEYFMVDFLIAENPNMDVKEAMQISSQVTKGEKFNIFLITIILSLIVSLGIFICCIGQFFLIPIMYIGYVEIYWYLKEKAINMGITMQQ